MLVEKPATSTAVITIALIRKKRSSLPTRDGRFARVANDDPPIQNRSNGATFRPKIKYGSNKGTVAMKVGPLLIKLRLICGDRFAMGPGKAELLVAIDREHSISGAARAMDMSYRRAWLLVDEMNRCFVDPLVETLSGGGRERGARLTAAGRAVVEAYQALEMSAAALADTEAHHTLVAMLRTGPLPAKEITEQR
jgi:molybdate transport system regulatory protein